MIKPVVYLAGPIAGTVRGEAFDWRVTVARALLERGIECRSPMRAKLSLAGGAIGHNYRDYSNRGWAYTPAGILTRDHNDCTTSDAVLVNMLGAKDKSFGTGMEIAWCYDRHIPTVVAIEDEGNIHDGHPMFVAAVKFRVPTLDEAIDAVAIILNR
jgi:nucleoside 2-deoxyribosyltransferase